MRCLSIQTSRTRGFSLPELILVVLILSVMGALAAPMFGNTDSTRLNAAARLLAADIAFAQNESISHADDSRLLIFDADANSYTIAAASDPDTPIVNPVGGKPYRVIFGQGRAAQLAGVSIGTLAMDGDSGSTDDRFQFGIYGQTDQATDPTITLTAQDMSIVVTVNASTGETTISSLY